MTMWQPSLSRTGKPLYLAIADAIGAEIASGRLKAGDRLPPHRDLADRIKVTVTTVTRGYAEAERRGLIEGEVGRGTFVRPALPDEEEGRPIDLSVNLLLPQAHAAELGGRLALEGSLAERIGWLDYQPSEGAEAHRAAGSAWLAKRGVQVAADRITVTAGAQHALAVSISALVEPGEELLTEEVTYAGVKKLGEQLRIPMRGIEMDEHGVRPDALESACRSSRARVLCMMPSIQNPTGLVMPENRKREIADIAVRHDLLVLEDDTYGFLVPDSRPLAWYAPDRTILVTSLSKSVAAGLRIGFIAAPSRLVDRLSGGVWTTMIMASPVTAAMAAAWIADGTADRIVDWKRSEIAARQALARRMLADVAPATSPASPHVWLPLARRWRSDVFAAHLRDRGVIVSSSDAFAVRPGALPRFVRVALGPPRTRERLERGLSRIAGALGDESRSGGAVV
jgi:DNA-binding transcriptional MocR family regulator